MSDINVRATGELKKFDVKGNDKKITVEDVREIVKDDKKKAALKEAISVEIEAAEKKPARRAQLLELYYQVDVKSKNHILMEKLKPFIEKTYYKH